MYVRIGFEFGRVGILGMGVTVGYFATGHTRSKMLYEVQHVGSSNTWAYGFIETPRRFGISIPKRGTTGLWPDILNHREVKLSLKGSWGHHQRARLSLEVGPSNFSSGYAQYTLSDYSIIINKCAPDIEDFIGSFRLCRLYGLYRNPGPSPLFLRGYELWEDIMEL